MVDTRHGLGIQTVGESSLQPGLHLVGTGQSGVASTVHLHSQRCILIEGVFGSEVEGACVVALVVTEGGSDLGVGAHLVVHQTLEHTQIQHETQQGQNVNSVFCFWP